MDSDCITKKITIFNIYRCWEPYDVWALSNKGLLDWMDKENVEYFCCYSSYKCVVAPNWNWNRGISIPAPRYEQTAALCLVWLHQGRLTLRWQQQQHSPLKPQHLRTRLQKQLCQHPTEASLMVSWLPQQLQCNRLWWFWGCQKPMTSCLVMKPIYENIMRKQGPASAVCAEHCVSITTPDHSSCLRGGTKVEKTLKSLV